MKEDGKKLIVSNKRSGRPVKTHYVVFLTVVEKRGGRGVFGIHTLGEAKEGY